MVNLAGVHAKKTKQNKLFPHCLCFMRFCLLHHIYNIKWMIFRRDAHVSRRKEKKRLAKLSGQVASVPFPLMGIALSKKTTLVKQVSSIVAVIG